MGGGGELSACEEGGNVRLTYVYEIGDGGGDGTGVVPVKLIVMFSCDKELAASDAAFTGPGDEFSAAGGDSEEVGGMRRVPGGAYASTGLGGELEL